ncbi:MAG: hypothetical protein AAGB10_07400 [Pseudomonadota bacterium]
MFGTDAGPSARRYPDPLYEWRTLDPEEFEFRTSGKGELRVKN